MRYITFGQHATKVSEIILCLLATSCHSHYASTGSSMIKGLLLRHPQAEGDPFDYWIIIQPYVATSASRRRSPVRCAKVRDQALRPIDRCAS